MARKGSLLSVNFVKALYLVALLVSMPSAYAHEEEMHKTATEGFFHQFSATTVISLSVVAIIACVIMLLAYRNTLNANQKKLIFGIIALAAIATTGYLTGNTVYLTLTSWSNGIIHWHADFEIHICGEKFVLPNPTGIANRVGTETVHHHGDYRIHLEGVMKEREDAALGKFFDAINVTFSNERIMSMDNGDYCPDGKKGAVKMFVNGELYSGDYRDYVIAPYADVPPGDFIKIVFG